MPNFWLGNFYEVEMFGEKCSNMILFHFSDEHHDFSTSIFNETPQYAVNIAYFSKNYQK